MLRLEKIVAALVLGALAAVLVEFELSGLLVFVSVSVLAILLFYMLRSTSSSRLLHGTEPVSRPQIGEEPRGSTEMSDLSLIEKLPTPLLVVSRSGILIYANAGARANLPRLNIGSHFAHAIRAPAFVEAVSATLADGEDRSFHFTSFFSQEQYYEGRVCLFTLESWQDGQTHAIVQVEDRTRAHRAEQLRSDFIANASHELRTPLASIIGYIETLQHHAKDDPKAREQFLAIMAREASRMQRLVDDLMSLSRIEMTEHVRPIEQLSFNRIAVECAAAFRPLVEQEGVQLDIDLEPTGAEVRCDPDQLSQVMTNLIDNAIKYGGPKCHVRLHAAAPDRAHPNRVGISVTDDGPGIARDKVHRLTERFFRVSAGQSRSNGGTGLGLAIVKHILNRHKGRLEIVSEPGEGSTFTVWLPLAETTVPETAAIVDGTPAPGPETVSGQVDNKS